MKNLTPVFAALMVLACAGSLPAADAPANPAKPDLKPQLELAQKYDKFTHPVEEGTWEKGEAIPTAKKEDADAWTVDGGAITVDKDGMKIEAKPGVGAYATLAKKTFKGPIGIRYEAMTPNNLAPCDLSVRFGPVGTEPLIAFAFGGYANSENFLYLGRTRKVLGNTPLIQPGQWYTVECLIGPNDVLAKIDEKLIGQEKPAVLMTAETEHDISLYVWGTTGVFRNVQLMKYVPPKPDSHTWDQVMGKTTKEDLKALADKMGPLLANDDFTTRETAEQILLDLRPLSEDAVKEQLKSKDLEAKIRAERLGKKMGLIKEEPAAPAPAPDAPPTVEFLIK